MRLLLLEPQIKNVSYLEVAFLYKIDFLPPFFSGKREQADEMSSHCHRSRSRSVVLSVGREEKFFLSVARFPVKKVFPPLWKINRPFPPSILYERQLVFSLVFSLFFSHLGVSPPSSSDEGRRLSFPDNYSFCVFPFSIVCVEHGRSRGKGKIITRASLAKKWGKFSF